jgi:uncharacterized cupredoxin-like copper-binding protein
MRIAPLAAIALTALAVPSATAQAPTTVNVQLSNFKFTPRTIVLGQGSPYVLRLANVAGGGHNFVAPSFFAAAAIAPSDRRRVQGGEVEVPPGQVREIRLTAPRAGSYKVKCTHRFHKFLGMSGTIVVR